MGRGPTRGLRLKIAIGMQRAALAAALVALAGAQDASAFDLNPFGKSQPVRTAQSTLPPGDIPGAPMDQLDTGDSAALVLRIDRLEGQLRQATGQIEQLQNQQRRMEEQLKRFQEDVDFRLGGAHPGAPAAEAAPTPKPQRKSDAFDPAADPNAIGAPRPIGAMQPSAPLANAAPPASAPLDLSRKGAVPRATGGETPTVVPGVGVGLLDGPREQYNAALEAFRLGQYEQAEQKLRAFLAANPGNRLAPDAIFYLGESFFQRSRPREAAEQYLKLSTDYAKSTRAPDGLLRLGQSLAMLGNADQACATFGEVTRRYPTAAASLKKNVEREMQKDHC